MTDAPTDEVVEVVEIHGAPSVTVAGVTTAFPSAATWAATCRSLRDDDGYICTDLTAVDYLYLDERTLPVDVAPERFEVVVQLLSLERAERLRLRVQVSGDEPVLDSLFDVFPGTEALEREVFDMFGIAFTGHPDLTRILMPEDWDGYPLRKDYAIGRIPVQFKGAPSAR